MGWLKVNVTSSLSGSNEVFDKVINLLLPEGKEDMVMVDIGCGDARATKDLGFKGGVFVDLDKRENSPEGTIVCDALGYLDGMHNVFNYKFDMLYALDFIEHLTKDKGNELLDIIEERIKMAVLFTPLGHLAVSGGEEKFDIHKHWSGWLPEEFEARGHIL